jgi:hypothetical protein
MDVNDHGKSSKRGDGPDLKQTPSSKPARPAAAGSITHMTFNEALPIGPEVYGQVADRSKNEPSRKRLFTRYRTSDGTPASEKCKSLPKLKMRTEPGPFGCENRKTW